jgi:hypothetical protein
MEIRCCQYVCGPSRPAHAFVLIERGLRELSVRNFQEKFTVVHWFDSKFAVDRTLVFALRCL